MAYCTVLNLKVFDHTILKHAVQCDILVVIHLYNCTEARSTIPAFLLPSYNVKDRDMVSLFFQTDGASACVLMSEEKALELGYKPKAYLRSVLGVICFIVQ